MCKAIFVMLLFLCGHISAAEFSYGGNRGYTLLIEGNIAAGDADRMYQQLISGRVVARVELNSPGGDVVEALRMAALISGLKVPTKVPPTKICASACFFLYLAGEPREGAEEVVDWGALVPKNKNDSETSGRIGLHRPFLSKEFFSKVDAQKASKSQATLMKDVSAYLESKLVPRQLIELMMNRPSTDVYWMTGKDLMTLGEYSPDREELFTAKCGYDRKAQAQIIVSETLLEWRKTPVVRNLGVPFDERSEKAELDKKQVAIEKTWACISHVQDEDTYGFIHQLQLGWKPWAQDQPGNKTAGVKWVEILRGAREYADLGSIRKNGNLVQMWSLTDYSAVQQSNPDDKKYLSSTTKFEYDCKELRLKRLYSADHSENMGRGKVVFGSSRKFDDIESRPILKGSLGEAYWKVACGKR